MTLLSPNPKLAEMIRGSYLAYKVLDGSFPHSFFMSDHFNHWIIKFAKKM